MLHAGGWNRTSKNLDDNDHDNAYPCYLFTRVREVSPGLDLLFDQMFECAAEANKDRIKHHPLSIHDHEDSRVDVEER